eukprot:TRINITY_DN40867_c0_g2_i1.p1 TRINITY_DN40867_c0_g2~~TRINITY_DN40867_c0_g2_i1.p1  ORF type:complete len:362 (+),score=38.87 TRINITY_DN40867_c0_g2_i1:87-1172(+)
MCIRDRWGAAITAFKQAQPFCSEAHRLKVGLMLATLHTQSSRHREAIEYYRSLPEGSVGGSPDLSRGFGNSLAAVGEAQAARGHFERAWALREDFECLNQIGSHRRELGDVAGSVAILRKALGKNPRLGPYYRPFQLTAAQKSTGRVLHSTAPHAILFNNTLSAKQCSQLIDLFVAQSARQPALALAVKLESWPTDQELPANTDTDDNGRMWFTGQQAASKLHSMKWSSSGVALRGQVGLLDQVERVLEQTAGLPASHGLAWQLLEYNPNEGYHPHRDCVYSLRTADRMRTVLIYLNTVERGGETIFPLLNISVAPRRGNALVFSSQDSNGFCDPRSQHTADAPHETSKYVLQRWLSLIHI